MALLKKVAFVLLALVLLSLAKHLLDRYSRGSIVFHYNLLTCIQYFLLMGTLFILLVQSVAWIFRKRSLKLWHCAAAYLALLCCTEAYLYYALRNSEKVSDGFHQLLTEYYATYEINYPRLDYDPVLSYTLKKNAVYNHNNIEFSNRIHANSAGLRDDSASLVKPDIICLGDSYTMGWGVRHEQSWPQQLEKLTGLKVLNAGISSYGTVRELLLLERLDTSNLKCLVIQYCYNDWPENDTFLKHNRYLPVGSQQTINRTFKSYQLARIYFPFKYSLTMLRMFIRNKWLGDKAKDATLPWMYSLDYVEPSADAFLEVLYKSKLNFRDWNIIIIDTNRYPAYDHHFMEAVEKRLRERNYAEAFKRSIRLVAFPELNDQRYFYPLDNHLNTEGNRLVALKVMEQLRK